MGIIRAVTNAIGGGLADTWQEVLEPDYMGDNTCLVPAKKITQNGKSQNKKGSENIVSNGSIIHVYDNQFMMLIDGGKVVDFTAEPGYFKVDNSSMPSLFCGQFGDSIKETFNRIKFGGVPSQSQHVFYINLQEMKGIKFGTANPINYFDNFYNSELFIRAHGTYSVKVTDPLKFYSEVIPKGAVTNNESVDFQSVNQQYLDEFIEALASAINQYSADGNRVSFITSKSRELGKYMSDTLDEEWNQMRGMEIQSVGIKVSYDEESQNLINMRNKGAMMSDAAVQQGYVAANVSEGLKDAGSNANGSMAGFMGMGVGMNAGGGFMAGYQQNPQYRQQQPEQPQAPQTAPQQNSAPSGESWVCACGSVNTGKFCPECGSKKPEAPKKRFCTNCGAELAETAKFCPECGTKA
ncbi:MAG: SPFH domain-containing protein [Clostridiales bacterium]|nr:SPFH domain-containing protein [Clostridiales bacterium]